MIYIFHYKSKASQPTKMRSIYKKCLKEHVEHARTTMSLDKDFRETDEFTEYVNEAAVSYDNIILFVYENNSLVERFCFNVDIIPSILIPGRLIYKGADKEGTLIYDEEGVKVLDYATNEVWYVMLPEEEYKICPNCDERIGVQAKYPYCKDCVLIEYDESDF